MTVHQVKRAAAKLYADFGNDFASLCNILNKKGFTLIEFQDDISPDIEVIITKLDLHDYISRLRGFAYFDGTYRLVFMRSDLSAKDKVIVLAHEIGHIVCNHLSSYLSADSDVAEEMEANVFSYYLLHPPTLWKVWKNRIIVIPFAVLLVAILCSVCIGVQQRSYYGEYYVTAHGERYHQKECIVIKDRKSIHRLTVDEFNSGQYTPCQICLP